MLFMNDWDIDEAVARYRAHPVLSRATRTLRNVRDMADSTSDGWATWPKPCRAARKLQELIQGSSPDAFRDRVRADATEAKLRAAYTPIKTFCTRYAREVEFE